MKALAAAAFREGNGTPLQYSCPETPMDGGAWKAAVHGCREPARGVLPMAKVMRLRGLTGKGELGLKGASLDLLMHLPQNESLPALLHYAFTYSSDINRGYP